MKYFLLVLAVMAVTAKECKKEQEGIPVCVQQKIDSIKAQAKWNPPAEVHEYIYNNKRTFLFSSPCCDQYNVLYTENCEYICAPSGGITGRGDEKCKDFNQVAKHVKLVWKDAR